MGVADYSSLRLPFLQILVGQILFDFNEKWTTLLYNAEDDSSKTAAKAAIFFL